jgi:hypothetical protein
LSCILLFGKMGAVGPSRSDSTLKEHNLNIIERCDR